MNLLRPLLLISLAVASNSLYANKSELQKLEKQCADAREKKIAPLRKKEIEKCANKDRNTSDARKKCERRYIDYGEAIRHGHSGRMFNDLPDCLKFYDAEREYKKKSKR